MGSNLRLAETPNASGGDIFARMKSDGLSFWSKYPGVSAKREGLRPFARATCKEIDGCA
jgi:hypothetical protein